MLVANCIRLLFGAEQVVFAGVVGLLKNSCLLRLKQQ